MGTFMGQNDFQGARGDVFQKSRAQEDHRFSPACGQGQSFFLIEDKNIFSHIRRPSSANQGSGQFPLLPCFSPAETQKTERGKKQAKREYEKALAPCGKALRAFVKDRKTEVALEARCRKVCQTNYDWLKKRYKEGGYYPERGGSWKDYLWDDLMPYIEAVPGACGELRYNDRKNRSLSELCDDLLVDR